jgi:hypothetical protein
MSKHHIERCACGAILKLPAELDTGLCLVCLQRGECGREEPEAPMESEWIPEGHICGDRSEP